MMDEDIVLKIVRNFVLVALATSMLAACGGGSGGALAPVSHPTLAPVMPGAVLATRTLHGAAGFVNAGGFTVYVFDADLADPGHSTCNAGDGCSQNWPPLAPPAGVKLTGSFSAITRNDGTPQLTYAGRPLYTFVDDTQPGTFNGDGVNAFGGLWHIARPQSTSASSPSPMPTHSGY